MSARRLSLVALALTALAACDEPGPVHTDAAVDAPVTVAWNRRPTAGETSLLVLPRNVVMRPKTRPAGTTRPRAGRQMSSRASLGSFLASTE